jgi:hypothetical protein
VPGSRATSEEKRARREEDKQPVNGNNRQGGKEAADHAREHERHRSRENRARLHGADHRERRERKESEMRAGDEQAHEEQQRRELGGEDGPP